MTGEVNVSGVFLSSVLVSAVIALVASFCPAPGAVEGRRLSLRLAPGAVRHRPVRHPLGRGDHGPAAIRSVNPMPNSKTLILTGPRRRHRRRRGVAIVGGRALWTHYQVDPWTRDGRVRADVVQVAPDVSGLVTRVEVGNDQPVKAGQPLFYVDRERYALAERQAEAAVEPPSARPWPRPAANWPATAPGRPGRRRGHRAEPVQGRAGRRRPGPGRGRPRRRRLEPGPHRGPRARPTASCRT
jgi:hypothetical protein